MIFLPGNGFGEIATGSPNPTETSTVLQPPERKVLAPNREAVVEHHPGIAALRSDQDQVPGDLRGGPLALKPFATTS